MVARSRVGARRYVSALREYGVIQYHLHVSLEVSGPVCEPENCCVKGLNGALHGAEHALDVSNFRSYLALETSLVRLMLYRPFFSGPVRPRQERSPAPGVVRSVYFDLPRRARV